MEDKLYIYCNVEDKPNDVSCLKPSGVETEPETYLTWGKGKSIKPGSAMILILKISLSTFLAKGGLIIKTVYNKGRVKKKTS